MNLIVRRLAIARGFCRLDPLVIKGLQIIVLVAGFMSAALPANADLPEVPKAYVSAAVGGQFYFKMVPCPKDRWDFSCARGAVYEVSETGRDRLVWSVSGWYAHQTFLSANGRYLVRVGNWPVGSKPSERDLAVAFYDRGKLLQQYSTKRLIRDVTQVKTSISHYSFLREARWYDGYSSIFTMLMIDGSEQTFDASTGEIIDSTPPLNRDGTTSNAPVPR